MTVSNVVTSAVLPGHISVQIGRPAPSTISARIIWRRSGRILGIVYAADPRASVLLAEALGQAVRRRNHRSRARSRTRADQDRTIMGLCARRPTVERRRSA